MLKFTIIIITVINVNKYCALFKRLHISLFWINLFLKSEYIGFPNPKSKNIKKLAIP